MEQKPSTPISKPLPPTLNYKPQQPPPNYKPPIIQPLVADEVSIEPVVESMLDTIEEAVAKIGSAEKATKEVASP